MDLTRHFLQGFRKSSMMVVVALLASLAGWAQNVSGLPHLEKRGKATQLIVDGKPFLMLAGELGNSSGSDAVYMRHIWPLLAKMHLNTVLVPAYWELIEPTEGNFDFSLIDSVLSGAREQNLRVVFLWFGTWKNSMSCYAPYWVKTNEGRFPRARTANGKAEEILTPFSAENLQADIHAFSAFMRHLHAVDASNRTVLLVQVENEIGMIPEARDHCTLADSAYAGQVPSDLMSYLRKNLESLNPEIKERWQIAGSKSGGTWEEVFGQGIGTEEVFMAWYFGRYTNAVADAGKHEYPLPMYVNAALIRPDYKPGQYPSAGPLPHLFDIWRAAAPSIDLFAPDIYFQNFSEWCTKYVRQENPLFIPEARNTQSIANAFFAMGQLNAMGYSPFSIENVPDPGTNQVSTGYVVLQQLSPLIIESQEKGTLGGVLLDSVKQAAEISLGDYTFTFRHEYSWPYAHRTGVDTPRVGGMIIMLARDEFLIAGTGLVVTFAPRSAPNSIAGIASIDEGSFENGRWIPGRRLNGDEDHQGRHLYLPGGTFGIQKVKLYTYR